MATKKKGEKLVDQWENEVPEQFTRKTTRIKADSRQYKAMSAEFQKILKKATEGK